MVKKAVLLGAGIALALTGSALGGFVNLDGGWRAIWDSSLDGLVDINSLGYDPGQDALFIQKSAEFTQGPVNGVFPSIPIVFQATGMNPASHIVIDDEILFNNTGSDWHDFHLDLLDGGEVAFNRQRTLNSGGGGPIGWTIAPFQDAAFTPSNMRLDIFNGTIANGDFWFPGDGATNGQLWIDITNARQGSVFTLKETPTPAPGAVALLAVAGLTGRRRRR